jgi:hypothetical protein
MWRRRLIDGEQVAFLFPRPTGFPASVEGSVGSDFGQNWQQEWSNFIDEARQVTGLVSESASADECSPLENTCGVITICLRKPDGFGFNSRSSVPKRRDERLRQTLAIKRVHTV